ncbi:hypothetical protein BC826DRAFT_127409 [Russula brevipes]|nr:hypothetical protein BC826DRAFT_127409 [Russula brevipes]
MRWIRKHWTEDFVAKAEGIVKNLMEKYRHASVHVCAPQTQAAPKSKLKFDLGSYARRIRVADMVDFPNRDSPYGEQTVDHEFIAYTTGSFEQDITLDEDILGFWEVSIPTTHYHSILLSSHSIEE